MTWVKGAPNPGINRAGRAPNKRGMSAGELFVFRASKSGDAYTFFVEVMDNERVSMDFRTLAARELLKHQRAADPPIQNPVPLIEPQCAADAEHNIVQINYFETSGRIGPAAAAALRQGQRDWIEAHMIAVIQGEAREALRQFAELRPHLQELGQTTIGGLPRMPGSDIAMPAASQPWNGDKDKDESK
jgi:hypothetical protein